MLVILLTAHGSKIQGEKELASVEKNIGVILQIYCCYKLIGILHKFNLKELYDEFVAIIMSDVALKCKPSKKASKKLKRVM